MAEGNGPIRVVSRRLVKASDASVEPRVLPVSNLDLLYCTSPLSFVCFYPRPQSGADFGAVVASFESALPSFLSHFSPLAGRIVTNRSSAIPEIHCNNEGAELVIGDAGVPMSSLDFSMMGASVRKVRLPHDDAVALSVQVVSFACGGFSVAWRTKHILVDGCALYMLVGMWSAFARCRTIRGVIPSHDRSVLLPRSPPSYGPSFGDGYTPDTGERLVNALTNQTFVERLYYIEAGDVECLRTEASRGGGHRATRMEAVSAYLWKVLAAVVSADDERCRMGWWVNGRRFFASPEHRDAMSAYVGNVTSFAAREASVEEIRRAPLPDVASLVRTAVAATANAEHFQELLDWLEDHKAETYRETATVGLGSPTVAVTWCATFRPDTDFGFGHAALSMPTTVNGRRCSGYFTVAARPGGDDSLFASAFVWPRLAAALETDGRLIFKPVTAKYLGLMA